MEELESKIDFLKIQESMKQFHAKHGGRLPNAIIIPAEISINGIDLKKLIELFCLNPIYGAVKEPRVILS